MHESNADQLGKSSNTNRVIDPVCGMTVDPEASAGSHVHLGKTYYFCHVHCLDKFRANPEDILSRAAAPMMVQPIGISRVGRKDSAKSAFTCPMHPEIQANIPGACPKCGMALEPLTFSAPQTKTEYTCPMHPEIVRETPGSCPICGMALEPRTVTSVDDENPELRDMRRRFWISVALSLPVFLIGMSDLIPGQPLQNMISPNSLTWIQLVLASPVVLWCGWPFYVRAWQSLVNRSLNMFTLIGLGISVAYVYSLVATLLPDAFPHSFRGHGNTVPV